MIYSKRFLILERAKNFSSNVANVNADSRSRAKNPICPAPAGTAIPRSEGDFSAGSRNPPRRKKVLAARRDAIISRP
jgi:hypothetical protein